MSKLSKELTEEIKEILRTRGIPRICYQCNEKEHSLFDEVIYDKISQKMAIPCVALICENCGNMQKFCLGKLGILYLFKEQCNEND